MVRVPLPQEPGRVAGTGGYSAPGISPPAINAGAQTEQLGNVLTRAGLGVSDRAAALQETLHIAAVKEAQALAEERIGEAERAYLSAIGKAATGEGRKRADTELEAKLRAIEGGLGHEVERTLFRQVMGRRMTDVRARWGRHEDEQARVYEIGTSKAVLEGHIDAARRGGTQSDGTSMRAAKAEATMLAAKLGYGPEQTEQLVREATTAVHSGIVQDLATAGRGSEARSYLAGVEQEVEPNTLRELRGLVQRASVKQESFDLAVAIQRGIDRDLEGQVRATPIPGDPLGAVTTEPVVATAAERLNAGLAQVQAREEAGLSPEVADATRAELRRMAAEQQAVEAAAADRAARVGEEWLAANTYASVDSLPPDVYEEARRRGVLNDLRAYSGSAKRYTTDPGLFADLLTKPRGDGWFDRPLAEFDAAMRRRLDPQDHLRAIAMWREANRVAAPEDFALLTPLRRFEDMAARLKIDPKFSPESYDRLRRAVEDRVNARGGEAIAKNPRLLDEVIAEIEEETAFLPESFVFDALNADTEKPIALMSKEELQSAYVLVDGKRFDLGSITNDEAALVAERLELTNAERAASGQPPRVLTLNMLARAVAAMRGGSL